MTRIGPVAVRQPRVRDREAEAGAPGRVRVTPAILPPYTRCSKSTETPLPILYLKRSVDISPSALPRRHRCEQPPPPRPHFLFDHDDIEIAMPAYRK